MDLKNVENFSGGIATMLLFGEIGGDNGINGRWFAEDINALNRNPNGILGIDVVINSQGGSVIQALSIFSAIRESRIPCRTRIAGVAASSAGFIAMAGHTRQMNDFARLMVHSARIPDRVTLSENEKAGVKAMNDIIFKIMSNNSTKEESEIQKDMNKDTWFSSEQALNMGFVDEVLSTDRNLGKILNELEFDNNLSEIVNQLSNKLTPKKMDLNKIKASLFLDQNVSQDVVEAKIEQIIAEAKTAKSDLEKEKTEHETTKGKLSTVEAKVKETEDARAIEFVENCIKDGKFSVEKKDALIEQAKTNFDTFKAMAEAVATPSANISDVINEGGSATDPEAGLHNGKTLRQLEKEDPKALEIIRNENLDKYKAMYKAQYGVDLPE